MSVKQPRAKKKHQPKKQPAAETTTAPQKSETPADMADQVAYWLLAGNSDHDVAAAILDTWPKLTKPKALALIQATRQAMADCQAMDPAELAGWHRQARRELYRRAMEIHDYKTAHAILKELASLDGTGAQRAATPPASQPTIDDGIPDGAGPEIPTN